MEPVGACRVSRASLSSIAPADWTRLLATNRQASAFSDRAMHDAWWIAYGAGAIDESLAVHDGASRLCGYLPVMRRPDGVRYLGATYHSDYATVLLDLAPGGCAASAADAIAVELLADPSPLDLRRLRPADPAHTLLIEAVQRAAAAAHRPSTVGVEEPAPAIDLAGVETLDDHLERMDKKDRHEIRRKVRRGAAAGVSLRESRDLAADLPEFARLHRARWGERGLFTATPKGEAELAFMRALFASNPLDRVTLLFLEAPEHGTFAAGLFLRDAGAVRYWNAGGDVAARALSPGVLLFVAGVQRAIDAKVASFDFLRGNEPYKYECGAQDVPVMQLRVPAAAAATAAPSAGSVG